MDALFSCPALSILTEDEKGRIRQILPETSSIATKFDGDLLARPPVVGKLAGNS